MTRDSIRPAKPDKARLAAFRHGTINSPRTQRPLLGLFGEPPASAGGNDADADLVNNLMQLLIDLRASARKNKDFATADTIRDKLTEIGITLEDRPGGTEWTGG